MPLPPQLSPQCLLQAGGRTEIQWPLESLEAITPFPVSVSLRPQCSLSAPHFFNMPDGFSTNFGAISLSKKLIFLTRGDVC